MGIHGLTKLISDKAPGAIKEHKMDSYFGRKIAVDASMSIYQFLIAVRHGEQGQLTNESGEVTSHLTGMLYRTIRMMEAGIKPVFVFDGKAPTLKSGELAKRKERKEQAEAELTRLQESGEASAEDIQRQEKRLVRASREQSDEVKKLLTLMGLPVIDAPCEAEATVRPRGPPRQPSRRAPPAVRSPDRVWRWQCAKLAAAGLVFGTGTEDADALTFGTPLLVRHPGLVASLPPRVAPPRGSPTPRGRRARACARVAADQEPQRDRGAEEADRRDQPGARAAGTRAHHGASGSPHGRD